MKTDLIEDIGVSLLKRGYTVKYLKGICFDVLARKGPQILLIKALLDSNAIEERFADEMKKISSLIHAAPLIISEKAGSNLEDNVVYSRFDVYTLSPATFRNALDNKLPFVKRNKAGLTAIIIGQKLKEKREEKGYSLAELSRNLGVSRSMIVKYETELSEISLNKALAMYNVFGDKIFDKIDVLSSPVEALNASSSELTRKYARLGFNALETKNAPFGIIAKKEKNLILTEVGDKENPQFRSLKQLLDADNLIIFTKKKPLDVPAVTKKQFLEFESATDLIKFLKEF